MLEISSHLKADAAEVWRHATSFAGINDELMPLMRMTAPADWNVLASGRIGLGERLFRSWLLAFGALPVDYDA